VSFVFSTLEILCTTNTGYNQIVLMRDVQELDGVDGVGFVDCEADKINGCVIHVYHHRMWDAFLYANPWSNKDTQIPTMIEEVPCEYILSQLIRFIDRMDPRLTDTFFTNHMKF
jgi:hypothetical protein